MGNAVLIFLPALAFVLTFCCAWTGMTQLSLTVYIVVFLVLLFLSNSFFNGVRYPKHNGQKIAAKVCSVDILDDEQFYVLFKLKKEDIVKEKFFVFQYGIDGTMRYELGYRSWGWNLKEGQTKNIYVIRNQEGVETNYRVCTDLDIRRNFVMGIPFAIELVAWVFLFFMRGI